MARRPVHPPPKTRTKKREIVVDKSNLTPLSLEQTVEELKLQAKALDLSAAGCNHREIADQLDIHILKVPALLSDALGELFEKRDAAADKFFAIHRRRYDLLIKEWQPRALGYVKTIKNDDGALVEHTVPGDPKAAMIMAKIQADYAKMFGLNKVRIEHTGAHGGPILNVQIDWTRATDEQLKQAGAGDEVVIRQLSERHPAGSGGSSA